MAQQGIQMKVGAREGFAYNSVTCISLANGNRYEVNSITILLTGEALHDSIHLKYCRPNSDLY